MLVSISIDNNKVWKEATAAHDISWINLHDPKSINGIASNYGLTGIPHYVLISPANKVIDIWMGFSEELLTRKMEENIK